MLHLKKGMSLRKMKKIFILLLLIGACICNTSAQDNTQDSTIRYLRCTLIGQINNHSDSYIEIEYDGNSRIGKFPLKTGYWDIPFPEGIQYLQLHNEYITEDYFAIEVDKLQFNTKYTTKPLQGENGFFLQFSYYLQADVTTLSTHQENEDNNYLCDGEMIYISPEHGYYNKEIELQTSFKKYKPLIDLPIVQIAKKGHDDWSDINSDIVSIESNSVSISYANIKSVIKAKYGNNKLYDEYQLKLKYPYYNEWFKKTFYLYSKVMDFVYYPKTTYPNNSNPTIEENEREENVLKLVLGEEHQLTIRSKDGDDIYELNPNSTNNDILTFPSDGKIKLSDGLYRINLKNKYKGFQCEDIRYAVVFSKEHKPVGQNDKGEVLAFWSAQQAIDGRKGAIILKTDPNPRKSEGNAGSSFDFKMPSTITIKEGNLADKITIIDKDGDGIPDSQIDTNNDGELDSNPPTYSIEKVGADGIMLTHSLPADFCTGAGENGETHTITITPTGCIPQTIKYTLGGYYDNITIDDYSYFECNQDKKGGLLTINNISGGKRSKYLIKEIDKRIETGKPISIDEGLSELTIIDAEKDKDYEDGQSDRKFTLKLPTISEKPTINIDSKTNVTCFGGDDGGLTTSINVEGLTADNWNIIPSENTSKALNEDGKISFEGLKAGEYTVKCTIKKGCYTAETRESIAAPNVPLIFNLQATPTTCDEISDGKISLASIEERKTSKKEEETNEFTELLFYATEEQSQNLNNLDYLLYYKDDQQNDQPLPNDKTFGEGKYNVHIKVKNNDQWCKSEYKDVEIESQNPQETLELIPHAASCEAAQNGTLSFDPKGLFVPTTFSINNDKYINNDENRINIEDEPAVNIGKHGLWVGDYDINLRDDKNCYFKSTITIEPNSYSFTSKPTNASCAEAPNGRATIEVKPDKSGVFEPSEYILELIEPKSDNTKDKIKIQSKERKVTADNLHYGTYKLTVNHDDKCTYENTVNIDTNHYAWDIKAIDLSCLAAANGNISASINKKSEDDNGLFDINSFNWKLNGETIENGTKPAKKEDKTYPEFKRQAHTPGIYTLSIAHDNHCIHENSVEVKVNDYQWSTNHLYLSCEEVKNGYISATINRKDDFNGLFDINKYSWTVNDKPYKSGENPANEKDGTYSFELTDLAPGLYKLSLTHDDEKCTESTTVKIDVNDYYHYVTTTNAPCAEIPSATATAVTEILSGTEGSFKPIYSWTVKNSKPEPTGSVNTISNRFFGDYNVKIEWANGCSESIDFTIQHDTLKPSLLTTNAECSDKESVGGKAVLNISTPDKRTYSYSWDTQEDNNNIKENLPAGSHNVTVIDNHGCHLDVPFTILNANFSADVKTENALCRQDATGKVTFDIKGGRGMYTINWNGNSNLSQKNISSGIFTQENIPVGIYHVDIKDETNCVVSHKVTISSGNLKVSHKESDASCASIGNAQAEITVSGAKLPVTYKWSDNVETSEPLRSNLSKGNYVVTVVDQNDCSMPVDINIYSKKLSAETAIDSATCGIDTDGAADIRLYSATAPFSFKWSDGKATTTGRRDGMAKGEYTVHITDANGCEVSTDVFVPHKGYLQNDVPGSITLCTNGEITVDANEFIGYQWIYNGRYIDDNRFLTIKSPGTYLIKANGYDDCYAVDTIAVAMSPKSFSPYFRMSSVSYVNDTLVVMEMSQTNPDKYSWKYDTLAFDCDNTSGSERELRLVPKLSGLYSITLSAENEECVSDISKPVEIFATTRPDDDLSPLYVDNSIVKEFTISPNPTKGPITVEVNLSQIADVRLTIYDLNFGKIRKQVTLHNSDNYKLDINDVLYTGAYVVILQAGNETKQIKYIVGR